MRSGDTTSEIAKDFYKDFGDYIDEIKPYFGMTGAWDSDVNKLLEVFGEDINKAIGADSSIKTASDVPISMKPFLIIF